MRARSVVAGVVALGLLAAGALVVDGWARGEAEDRVAAAVTQELQVQGTPDVRIEGFPFLTQLLGGSLRDVDLTAPGVTLEGVELTDVQVRAVDVTLDEPHRAADVRAEATVPTASVQRLVQERVALDVTVDGDVLRASGDLLGIPLTAGLVPRVEDGRLLVDVQDVELGAATLRLDELPGGFAEELTGLEVPLDGLPPGIVLAEARVVPDGVQVVATGTDVVLREVP